MTIRYRLNAGSIKSILLSVAVVFFSMACLNAAGGEGTASAEIVAPLGVSSMQDINFGKIMQSSAAETLVLSSSGAVSGTAVHLGSHQKGIFTVHGQPGAGVSFSVSGASLSGPGGAMSMSGIVFDISSPSALDAAGMLSVGFGASLSVGAGQETGLYTGSYTITVNYI